MFSTFENAQNLFNSYWPAVPLVYHAMVAMGGLLLAASIEWVKINVDPRWAFPFCLIVFALWPRSAIGREPPTVQRPRRGGKFVVVNNGE
jgi:hypothetical protein